ncbi:hypothetical protein B296_00050479 [Ensete ventricosum]|uniref:Uncharacterized protein n=1 Tax=Ensete ventricosum TaxID=4639 RepID=A0A426WXZ1_ENSVE|nr:hypothetical protein B296_00050479 [Ensete ventricosum]
MPVPYQVSSTRSGLNRVRIEENNKEFGQERRKTTESSVLCSAGLGEHERQSRKVDLYSRSLREGGVADLVWDRPP